MLRASLKLSTRCILHKLTQTYTENKYAPRYDILYGAFSCKIPFCKIEIQGFCTDAKKLNSFMEVGPGVKQTQQITGLPSTCQRSPLTMVRCGPVKILSTWSGWLVHCLKVSLFHMKYRTVTWWQTSEKTRGTTDQRILCFRCPVKNTTLIGSRC